MGDKEAVKIEVEPEVIIEIDDDSDNSMEYTRSEHEQMNNCQNDYYKLNNIFANKDLKRGEKRSHDQCPECGKYYRKLAKHMLKHVHHLKSLNCDYCNKPFGSRMELEAHVPSHNKPFECNLCHKTFSQNCNLINHIRTHTGDKPYKCKHCSRAFTQSGNLKNHMRLHNDEKPFVCSICNAAFRQLSNLNNHSKKHPNFQQSPLKHTEIIDITSSNGSEIRSLCRQTDSVDSISVPFFRF